ncbi:alpha/beta fold hydrolase [Streptomyces sp. NPDC020983]|uniref:alpha/beta fold hydrolase n=1 Tax=Streptomyces sp. NPDC020983 TaxID=3365106 RepID=UPI0037B547E4
MDALRSKDAAGPPHPADGSPRHTGGGGQHPARTPGVSSDCAVPFLAGDGTPLSLVNVRGRHAPTRGPVLLVHGAGVRAATFRPPTGHTIVDALLAAGFDVWLENWRAGADRPPAPWTLDDAAAYDHPAAVAAVLRHTGADRLPVVAHCQGSTSFVMALIAGLVPQVDTFVSSAVSLHPVVPRAAARKLRFLTPPFAAASRFVDAQWGARPRGLVPRLTYAAACALHRECADGVCRMASFMFGAGHPTLWRHENLDDATHTWLRDELGWVPLDFFRQMARCVRRGSLVPVTRNPLLPDDFATADPRTDARCVFLTGTANACFAPESQLRSHEHFTARRPREAHTLHLVEGYGHQDVFIGRNAARDVFPLVVAELTGRPPVPAPQAAVRARGGANVPA